MEAALTFWCERMAQSRALWEGAQGANDRLDLWADIETLLSELGVFQEERTPDAQTLFRVGSEAGQAIVGLGSCECSAIWSVIAS